MKQKSIKKLSAKKEFQLNKNRTHFEFLTTYSPFYQKIREVRKKFNIPNFGFIKGEEVKKWQYEQYDNNDLITNSAEFKEKEEEIKNNFKLEKISKKIAEEQWSALYDKLPLDNFTNICREIIQDFRLPINYEMMLRMYILRGEIKQAPAINYGFMPEKDKLVINIYSKLTKEEMNDLLKTIRIFNKKLPHITMIPKNTKGQLDFKSALYTPTYYQKGDKKVTKKELAQAYIRGKNKKKKGYEALRQLDKKYIKRFG
ncbi:MAG: hypothetical protein WCX46_01525 [Candidatus Paceibacterota bacterium]